MSFFLFCLCSLLCLCASPLPQIRADIPDGNYGGNVMLTIPLPKTTSSVVSELPVGAVGQSSEYDAKERKVVWRIKKFQGGHEQTLRCKITLSSAAAASIRKEIGPLSLNFEIPMYNPSGLQVRYLRILGRWKNAQV